MSSSEPARSPRRWWPTACIVTLICLYAIGIRTYNLTEPWGRHLLGINGAWHSIIARNVLRYGFVATKGAAVLNTGVVAPSEFAFYLHHPPLLDWLIALSFWICGVHEWSARLVSLLFGLGCMFIIFRMAQRLYSTQTAVVALFFAATIPMSVVYGMHVDFQGPVPLLFALAAMNAYEHLVESQHRRDQVWLVVFVTLCCLVDWPGFYLVPLMWFHQWFCSKRTQTKWLSWLLVYTVALLGLLFVHCWTVTGKVGILFHQFAHRSFDLHDDAGNSFTLLEWIQTIGSFLWRLYTPPILLAVAVWLGRSFWPRRVKPTAKADGFVLLLMSFGLAHLIVAFQGAYQHDCLSLYLLPAFSICAARVSCDLFSAAGRLGISRWSERTAVCVGAVILTTWFGFISVQYPKSRRQGPDLAYGYRPIDLGRVVHDHTQPDEACLITGEDSCTPALWFYADRPLSPFVSSVDSLREALVQPTIWGPECHAMKVHSKAALFVIPRSFVPSYEDVVNFLRTNFLASEEGPFLVFDLRRPLQNANTSDHLNP